MEQLPRLTYSELVELVIVLVDEKMQMQAEIDQLCEVIDAFRVLDTMRGVARAVDGDLAKHGN
jgi:hypothetical protein